MALVFDEIKDAPQTHILIIGVGNYPYTSGGVNFNSARNATLNDIGQLSSPKDSAAFFYRNMLDFHKNASWTVPLGSIEFLSESPVNASVLPANTPFQQPTKNAVRSGYQAWKSRCNSHEDNVAIFYFCRHGLQGDDHFLLCADFGEDQFNPWEHAFAFDLTCRAFRSCKARTQLFFVDACRNVTTEMLINHITVSPLEQLNLLSTTSQYSLILKASCHNESAFGPKNAPSFFCQALIRGMRNDGLQNNGTNWVVSSGEIAKNINLWMKNVDQAQGYSQRCQQESTDTFELLKFNSPPKVPVELDCQPSEALPLATLRYQNIHDTTCSGERDPTLESWKLELPSGIYQLDARYSDPRFRTPAAFTYIGLPFSKNILKAQ